MKRFVYMLAPMEDVTDAAMRTLCYRHGADITFTEMIRFDSLAKKIEGSLRMAELLDETPTWIQIVGSDEKQLKRYLHDFKPKKGFLGFNFNLGCPSFNLTDKGVGCAMVTRIAKTSKLLNIVRKAGYKASIKMRLGLNDSEKRKKVYLNLIRQVNPDMFIVHSRVGTDTYDTPADHSVLKDCVASKKMIVANGDIDTKEKVQEVRDYGAQGVMIGRSAICNPSIFNTLKGKPAVSIETLRAEYNLLADKFSTPSKYRKNVLKHLGKNVSTNNSEIKG
jgi:tRNA-dihydrouridine synthase B